MGAEAAPGMLWPSRGLGDRRSQPAGNLLTLGNSRDCQADEPGVPVLCLPAHGWVCQLPGCCLLSQR